MKNIKQKVNYILSKHPQAREDDRVLYQYYLIYTQSKGIIKDGENTLINIEVIANAPNMDTLGRHRRKIQSLGHYTASQFTRDKRAKQTNKLLKAIA